MQGPKTRQIPSPVLQIKDLAVSYRGRESWQQVIRDINLQIHTGQTYGLVGESGSGKTTLALAIMGFLGQDARVDLGSIYLDGEDVCRLDQIQLQAIWGKKISFVPQDPFSSLNPSIRIGDQIAELIKFQLKLDPPQTRTLSLHLLEMVHISDPSRVLNSYPHQVSGGMQQRILIAMALSTEPKIIILDEPTTSLDVTTQATVLDLIRDLISNRDTAVLYVSHNLGVIADLCDRVAVLYAGELVEDADVRYLFKNPLHPYTRGLLNSIPRLGTSKEQIRLEGIDGQIPAIGERPHGCIFEPRCPLAIEICQTRPPLFRTPFGNFTRCHRWEEIASNPPAAISTELALLKASQPRSLQPTLVLEHLDVKYPLGRSVGEILRRTPVRYVEAVRDVDLTISQGTTLGLVGESGSGKTTLARGVVGLAESVSGQIELNQVPLPPNINHRSLETLRQIQMVFQNPEDSLNPYLTVGETLRRPLIRLLGKTRSEADELVRQLLATVHLPPSYSERYPTQLSGGEKQRVAIGRALASNPKIIVFDEPVSSLDVSVQASILNLIHSLQEENQTSQLFISHNLAIVGFLADNVAVIYLGQLMELTPTGALFEPPFHPYTEALLSAIPLMDPDASRPRIRLEGDIPLATDIPTGCPFHSRCPRLLGPQCVNQTPTWQITPAGKQIFCHIPFQDLQKDQADSLPVTGAEPG
jgi:peptide/nickel transport system ATP-binding protein